MKFFSVALLSVLPVVLAQDPTSASVDPTAVCEPHGDHWHCPEGVTEPTIPPPTDVISAPTPTITDATAVCEPHGDHWHCPEGVTEPTTPPPSGISVTDDHHDDHTETGSVDPGPSPTQSYGCEPHGDHWHCEGPVTASPAAGETPGESGAGSQPTTGAAPIATAYFEGFAGAAAIAGAAFLL